MMYNRRVTQSAEERRGEREGEGEKCNGTMSGNRGGKGMKSNVNENEADSVSKYIKIKGTVIIITMMRE